MSPSSNRTERGANKDGWTLLDRLMLSLMISVLIVGIGVGFVLGLAVAR